MSWLKKRKSKLPKPVLYPIEPGQVVKLTLVGVFDGREIQSKHHSYFQLGMGVRQVDPAVWVEPYQEEEADGQQVHTNY